MESRVVLPIRGVGTSIVAALVLGMFAARVAVGISFPIVMPNFSGNVLLAANEDEDDIIALPIATDGTILPTQGISLGDTNSLPLSNISNADGVAATPDGKFAYLHDENDTDFYRFDLQHLDPSGGNSHIAEFDFGDPTWAEDGLLVLGSNLYAVAEGEPNALDRMAINPTTGDLSSPVHVADLTDGTTSAGGSFGRLATDGTCVYVSDSAAQVVFQVCNLDSTPTVVVWADAANGGAAPGISDAHTISFGPGNQNLFLAEDGNVYSTTGPVGSTPGSFSFVFTIPSSGGNEGSALLIGPPLPVLYVGSESGEEIDSMSVSGAGALVSLANLQRISGEVTPENAPTGGRMEFDEVEGLVLIPGSPRFTNGLSLFSTLGAPAPLLSPAGLAAGVVLLFAVGFASLWRRRASL